MNEQSTVKTSLTYAMPTTEDLMDAGKLRTWLEKRLAFSGIPMSHYTLIRCYAAAERAREIGDEPAKLFAWLITRGTKGDWSFLTDEQIERGKQRLLAMADAERDPWMSDIVQDISQKWNAADKPAEAEVPA